MVTNETARLFASIQLAKGFVFTGIDYEALISDTFELCDEQGVSFETALPVAMEDHAWVVPVEERDAAIAHAVEYAKQPVGLVNEMADRYHSKHVLTAADKGVAFAWQIAELVQRGLLTL